MQIESRLQERQGGAVTNFPDRLPPPQSDLTLPEEAFHQVNERVQ